MNEMSDSDLKELIARAQESGRESAAAALSLLEAFINGNRSRTLADYVARCLGEYLRGRAPIELALHLSSVPILRGAGGEGDRRRSERPPRATQDRTGTRGAGEPERRHLTRQAQGGRDKNRRHAAQTKGAHDKRRAARAERRRKTVVPPVPDSD